MNTRQQLENAQHASRLMIRLKNDQIVEVINDLADRARKNSTAILAANRNDLARMPQEDPRFDRLMLNDERIRAIADDLRNVASLKSPVGEIIEQKSRPNGLHLQKIRVPLGVVGIIYEAR
ncbi:MAG: gamma-glutamyl-phosphate reductase, partial [Candidatus Riflebacteria bacterium]